MSLNGTPYNFQLKDNKRRQRQQQQQYKQQQQLTELNVYCETHTHQESWLIITMARVWMIGKRVNVYHMQK